MNILRMLKSCRGAVNKVALLGTCVVAGIAGLNLYNYATTRPAQREARVQNLASMMKSGHMPEEYAKIDFELGNTRFATAQEIAEREGTASFMDGGEGRIAQMEKSFTKGQVFSGGDNSLGMGGNKADLIDGKGIAGGTVADGASDAANAAAVALGQAGAGQGADGVSGAGQRNGAGAFRASQITHAGGHNLGEGGINGFGPSGLTGRRDNQLPSGTASVTGAMAVGSALRAAGDPGLLSAGRSAKYVNGNRDTRLGMGESVESRGLRGIAIHSGKVAATPTRAANEGASPFLSKHDIAGSLEAIGEAGLLNDSSMEGIGNDSFNTQSMINMEDAFEEELKETDTTEQEKGAKLNGFGRRLLVLIPAAIAAMFAIVALAKIGGWAWAGVAAVAAVMLGLLGWFMADVINDYVKLYGSNGWTWTFLGLAGVCCAGVLASVISAAAGGKFAIFLAKAAASLGMGLAPSVTTVASAAVNEVLDHAFNDTEGN